MNEYNQKQLGVTEELAGVPMSFDFIPKVLKKAGYVSHQVGKWHIGFFDHDHVPVGRGFATSFGYMLGASSHDNRSSQVSHTCGLPVKDLYNSTRIANDTGGYGFNNVYSAEMYGDIASGIVASHDAATPLFLYMGECGSRFNGHQAADFIQFLELLRSDTLLVITHSLPG
jgi:hypothetical protein